MLDSEHDFAYANPATISQHMQKLKCERDIGGNQGSKYLKLLFMGVRAFIEAEKREMHYLCMPF
jgi:hypothetical protein